MQSWLVLLLTAECVNQADIIHAKWPASVNPTWRCLELGKGQSGRTEDRMLAAYLIQLLKSLDRFAVVNEGIRSGVI